MHAGPSSSLSRRPSHHSPAELTSGEVVCGADRRFGPGTRCPANWEGSTPTMVGARPRTFPINSTAGTALPTIRCTPFRCELRAIRLPEGPRVPTYKHHTYALRATAEVPNPLPVTLPSPCAKYSFGRTDEPRFVRRAGPRPGSTPGAASEAETLPSARVELGAPRSPGRRVWGPGRRTRRSLTSGSPWGPQ
jgi:hypothetical protein